MTTLQATLTPVMRARPAASALVPVNRVEAPRAPLELPGLGDVLHGLIGVMLLLFGTFLVWTAIASAFSA